MTKCPGMLEKKRMFKWFIHSHTTSSYNESLQISYQMDHCHDTDPKRKGCDPLMDLCFGSTRVSPASIYNQPHMVINFHCPLITVGIFNSGQAENKNHPIKHILTKAKP